MPLRPPRSVRAAALAAVTALLAACTGGASPSPAPPTSPPATPGGSGAAACTTAPEPGSDLPGWDVASQTPTVLPVLIASVGEVTCGRNRLLFTFLDKSNVPAGAPDRSASIALYNLGRDAETPIATVDGTFIWAIEGERGIYVGYADLPEAGIYGAEFSTAVGGAEPEKIRYTFQVQPSSPLIKVGQKAPATDNPTLADVDGEIARISTDTDPIPALYETSVADALAAHEPFLVAFATPAFCKTAQCGPTLDRLKPFIEQYPGVTFINVEPYELTFEAGSLEPVINPTTNDFQTVAATDQWGLRSEPWVFVVDRDGVVQGSFGLIFSDQEITTALDAVK